MMLFLIISGLFGKKGSQSDDLLPPPPPFPGVEALDNFDVSIPERKKKKNATPKKKPSSHKKIEASLDQHLPSDEQDPLDTNKPEKKKGKGKAFHFFHKTGVIKTKEQKKIDDDHKKHFKKHKDLVNEEMRIEQQNQNEKKKSFFSSTLELLFPKKEKKTESDNFDASDLDAELNQMDKDIQMEQPLHEDEVHDVGKSHDQLQAENEIEEAIQAVKHTEKKKKFGLFGKKKKSIKEEPSIEQTEQPIEQPEVMPIADDLDDDVEHIEEQVHKTRLALMDFNFEEAKKIYVEIIKEYNSLETEKQRHVYEDIKDLYYERKNAEKFRNT